MADNDQYSNRRAGTFTPVAVLLLVAIAAIIGIVVYTNEAVAPPPAAGTPSQAVDPSPNPNQLTPSVPGTPASPAAPAEASP